MEFFSIRGFFSRKKKNANGKFQVFIELNDSKSSFQNLEQFVVIINLMFLKKSMEIIQLRMEHNHKLLQEDQTKYKSKTNIYIRFNDELVHYVNIAN